MAQINAELVKQALLVLAAAEHEIENFDGNAGAFGYAHTLGEMSNPAPFANGFMLTEVNPLESYFNLAKTYDAEVLSSYVNSPAIAEKAIAFLNRLVDPHPSTEARSVARLRALMESRILSRSLPDEILAPRLESIGKLTGVADETTDKSYGKLITTYQMIPSLVAHPADFQPSLLQTRRIGSAPTLIGEQVVETWDGTLQDAYGNTLKGEKLGPRIVPKRSAEEYVHTLTDKLMLAFELGLSFDDEVSLAGDIIADLQETGRFVLASDYTVIEKNTASSIMSIFEEAKDSGLSANTFCGFLSAAVLAWGLVINRSAIAENEGTKALAYCMGIAILILLGEGLSYADSMAAVVVRVRDTKTIFNRGMLLNVADGGRPHVERMLDLLDAKDYSEAMLGVLSYIPIDIEYITTLPGMNGLDLRPSGKSVVMKGLGDVEPAAANGYGI